MLPNRQKTAENAPRANTFFKLFRFVLIDFETWKLGCSKKKLSKVDVWARPFDALNLRRDRFDTSRHPSTLENAAASNSVAAAGVKSWNILIERATELSADFWPLLDTAWKFVAPNKIKV